MAAEYTYPKLASLFERAIQRIDTFEDIPDDLFNLKPDDSSWSAAEIFQHLIQFNNLYLAAMDQAVESSQIKTTHNALFRARIPFRFFIRLLNPPYKLKMKTLAPMYPGSSDFQEPQNILSELKKTNSEILNRLIHFKSTRLDLNRIRGKNPLAPIPMSLAEFVLVLDAHQRRHFWQTERTLHKLSGEIY